MQGFRQVKDELAVVGFVVIILVMFSSVAIHEFEHDSQPDKFGRLSDSVWWSFVTLTTVGYGDIYPITAGGRVIAVATMIVGIGIFGTFISLIGSSFLSTMRRDQQTLEQQEEEEVEQSLPEAETSTIGVWDDAEFDTTQRAA